MNQTKFDCPNCKSVKSIAVSPGITEVTCTVCGEQFEISDTDTTANEQPPAQSSTSASQQPATQAGNKVPIAASAPVQPAQYDPPLPVAQAPVAYPSTASAIPTSEPGQLQKVNIDKIVEALKSQDKPSQTRLSEAVDPADFGLNARVKASRAWRYAQELGRTGNPYRENSASWVIYNCYVEQPRTIVECVLRCDSMGMGKDSFSFIVLIHSVTIDCIAAGLLLLDNTTRKIRAHNGKPIPTAIRG